MNTVEKKAVKFFGKRKTHLAHILLANFKKFTCKLQKASCELREVHTITHKFNQNVCNGWGKSCVR